MVLIKSRLKNTVFQPLSTSLGILFSSKAATEVLNMRNGVVLEIDDEVAVITINRPQARNALDLQSTDEFKTAVAKVENEDSVRAVVLTGAGGVFCSGADLREMADKGAVYKAWAGADGPLAKRCLKPVIAAVEGYAVAGGLGVALWADLRVADSTAVFGVFCRRFGIPMSDGTPTRLPKVIGRAGALDMLLTGRSVNTDEAFRIGLVDRVTSPGETLRAAKILAREIATFPNLAMLADRTACWQAFDLDEASALLSEERGAQAAKASEAAAGAVKFKDGMGRGGSPRT